MLKKSVGLIAATLLLLANSAWADTILYNNDTGTDYQVGLFLNNFDSRVSDSFSLSSNSDVTSAVLLFAIVDGDPSTVSWELGTSAGAFDVASGQNSPVTSQLRATTPDGFSLYEATLPLDLTLGAGTYWLTLYQGENTGLHNTFWVIDNGPSQAEEDMALEFGWTPLQDANGPGSGSEAFQILGNPVAAVPEPASFSLLIVGIGVFGFIRRRKAATA